MKRYLLAISAFALASFVFDAAAEAWPTKPLRAIVPVGAGSSTDIVHRLVLEQVSAQIRQPIVIENRAGAGGTIGCCRRGEIRTRRLHDSCTRRGPHHCAGALQELALPPSARLHRRRCRSAFRPAFSSYSPAKGINSAAELVTAAKARPGALNFSSVGVGSATHLSAERFVSSAGIQAVHVPFKGGAEATLEVIAGRVDFFFGPVALVLPHIRDGKLRALAVNGSSRSTALPDVPTLREAGIQRGGIPHLVRAIRASQNAFGHREQTQSRNVERAASVQGARETRSAWRRSYGHVASASLQRTSKGKSFLTRSSSNRQA